MVPDGAQDSTSQRCSSSESTRISDLLESQDGQDTSQTTNKQAEHDPSGKGKPKDTPPKATEGKNDTASLMRQLLAALEKHEKQGEHSKGEEIPSLPYLDSTWSTSSTPAGVKTTRRPGSMQLTAKGVRVNAV